MPSAIPKILVTGANQGIGLALVKQLCKDHGAYVYLGSRNAERGKAAVEDVKKFFDQAQVELVEIDVGRDDSVQAAAAALKEKGVQLNAVVNNAGLAALSKTNPSPGDEILNVNILGVKRVTDAFMPLLLSSASSSNYSRIVNVGSGSGPLYVAEQPLERQKILCNPDITWEEIDAMIQKGVAPDDPAQKSPFLKEYGLSKALLSCYTMMLAKEYSSKHVLAYCLSPGYIATSLTSAYDGGKPPEEGTVSIRHCLFQATPEQSGWFFGSDAKRSPLHYLRNPGEPEFDGKMPW